MGAEPISFVFGQRRDGTVFFSTSIWGNPSIKEMSASAEVKTPQKIRITEEHLAVQPSRTLRVVQKSNLLMKPNRIIDCLETIQIFRTENEIANYGEIRPEYSAIFHGSLHILTDAEENALAEELRRKGSVPQGDVTGSSKFSN